MATIDGGILGGNREEIARGAAELECKEAAAAERAADQEKSVNKIEDALTSWLRTALQEMLRRLEASLPPRLATGRGSLVRRGRSSRASACPSLQGGNLGRPSCR